jgi:hypothetical protein
VGHGGKSLDKLLIPGVSDKVKENGEGHGEPGEQNRQAAHGKGINHDIEYLPAFRNIGKEIHKPVESDKGGIKKFEGRTVIEESVGPAVEGKIGEQKYQEN